MKKKANFEGSPVTKLNGPYMVHAPTIDDVLSIDLLISFFWLDSARENFRINRAHNSTKGARVLHASWSLCLPAYAMSTASLRKPATMTSSPRTHLGRPVFFLG
ncbi:hypothetical protein I7I53_01254 [Histoplasma capsulatum var. duboisii H88]|uniref:Uncharacterized protein n=1 Tax=Ajellomyces capsulatus (strain H88) TaxID=544711 RepID=A0A8A1LN47_AJEC8|nr:hypothetical protein I7I53_01254 [Histoplasma capsulatum var. duboisii H88]